MYKSKCLKCGYIWPHEDDYCPDCGSGNFEEFHLIECQCDRCRTFKVKNRPHNQTLDLTACIQRVVSLAQSLSGGKSSQTLSEENDMGDLVAALFTDYGPVACCPECEGTSWTINLNGFEQRWDKITGTTCINCGFTVDWVSCEIDRDADKEG